MHYYQFNIGDYAKATRHLTNLEDLAYRRLIDLYYDKEEPLIKDVAKLSRLINMRDNKDEITVVLEDFFEETEGGYRQSRIDMEIAIYKEKAETARANGKKGGRPKKPKPPEEDKTNPVTDGNPEETGLEPRKTQPVNLANPEETGLKANQEPITNNQEPITSSKDITSGKPDHSAAFDEIFDYWCQAMNKTRAMKSDGRKRAVKGMLNKGYTVEEIKLAIYNCSQNPHNNGTDPKGNGKRYDDLTLICRDPQKLEHHRDNAPQPLQQYSETTRQNIENLKDGW